MRTPIFLRRPGTSSGGIRRNLVHTFGISALVALLMASGVGVTFALWNSQAEASSSITGAKLELTTTFQDLNFTFTNSALRTTGTFTITNLTDTSSSREGTVTSQLSAPGDSALASVLGVAVWRNTVAACTVSSAPASAVTGTWNAIAPVTTMLTPGASATYCVRVTGVERGVMGAEAGTMAITPTVSANLTVGSWSSGTVTATATQTTSAIYPPTAPATGTWQQIVNQQTQDCVDVHGNTTDSGTGVIEYPCKWGTGSDTYNQQWQFATSVTVNGGTYYTLTPRHATSLRMGVEGGSANSLAEVEVQTGSTSQSQQWQPQYRASGVFQLVNRNSGLCLTPHDTSTYSPELEYVQAVCDSARVDQTFSAHAAFAVPTMTLVCAPAANGGVTYTWSGGTTPGVVSFSATPDAGGSVAALGSTVYSTGTFTVLPAQLGVDGGHTLSAVGGGSTLTTAPLWRSTAGGNSSLSCTSPIPAIDSMNCVASGSGSGRIVTCTFSPAANGEYTLQAASVTSAGATWTDIATTTGSSFVITGSGVNSLNNGGYNIRVRDGAGNLLNNAWRITVGSSGSGWQSYKYPSNPTASIASFSCFDTGSGNNRRVSYAWDLEFADTLTFEIVRSGTATTMATAPARATAQAVTWTAPSNWPNGTNTYTVRVLDGATQLPTTLSITVIGNGSNKYLRCG